MCDIVSIKCDDPGCEAELYTHIGDFCTPAENVAVRCQQHPPTEGDGWEAIAWAKFTNVRDDLDGMTWPGVPGDWYMAVRDPALVDDVDARIEHFPEAFREFMRRDPYGVGTEGDIVPNLNWDTEEPYTPDAAR